MADESAVRNGQRTIPFSLPISTERRVLLQANAISSRFPARSPVNKRGRESMFRRFEESGSTERRDILEAQIAALETMPPLQKKLYPSLRRELDFYRRQLAQVRERP